MKGISKAAVLVATLASGFATPVQAAGRIESETYYYSDENYSQQVGLVTRFCDGTVYKYGTTFVYYSVENYYGCD